MTIKSPESLAELLKTTIDLRREVRAARQSAGQAGADAVERISHAYNFAGVDDAKALAIAGNSLAAVQRIATGLQAIDNDLKLIGAETRKAAAAVEEAQARRSNEARRLKI